MVTAAGGVMAVSGLFFVFFCCGRKRPPLKVKAIEKIS
jgi:hypothetical protein